MTEEKWRKNNGELGDVVGRETLQVDALVLIFSQTYLRVMMGAG